MHENIREGFDVFLHDGDDAIGAVRRVFRNGIVVYVENGGDFEVPLTAVKDTQAEKVVLDSARLPPRMMEFIARRHRGEDPELVG